MSTWTKIGCAAVVLAFLTASAFLAYLYVSFLIGTKLATEGYAASAHGDYDTAIAHYRAALQERIGDDQKALVYVNRGTAYNFKSRFDDAIRDHTEALQLNPNLADAYAGRGWAYFRKNEFDKAVVDLSEAIKLDPNSESAYYYRALILARRGEFDKALADLDEAVRCSPKRAYALVARGLCYTAKNDLDSALASFDGAVAMEPTNAIGYFERSKLYSRMGEREKAERDYLEALRLDPDIQKASMNFMQWFVKNQPSTQSQEFVTKDAGKTYRQMFQEAKLAYDQGNYEDAIALNNGILAMSPSPKLAASALMNRGNAYAAKGDLDKALQDSNEAIQLDPGKAGAYVDRAFILGKKGRHEEAVADCNEAIRINPQEWQAYFDRAADLRDEGELTEAVADLTEVTRLNPKFVGAYVNRASIYVRQGKVDEAIGEYNAALQLEPNRTEVYIARAQTFLRQKKYRQALADLQTAVQMKPKKPAVALNSLAWLRATCPEPAIRDGKEAVERAIRACELSEWKELGIIDTLAAAYAEAGNFDQAIKYQKQVVEMTKASPQGDKFAQRLGLYQEHKAYREESN